MSPPRRFNRVLSYWFSFCSPHRLVSVRMHLMLNARSTHRRRKQKSQFHSNELITKAIRSSRTHKKNFFLAMLSRKKMKRNKLGGSKKKTLNSFWLRPKTLRRNIEINMHEIIIAEMFYAHVNYSPGENKIAFMIYLHIYWLKKFNNSTLAFLLCNSSQSETERTKDLAFCCLQSNETITLPQTNRR